MPKVPQYTRQVEERTPTVQAPNLPNPVRAAFGENVAQEISNLGAQIQNASGVMADHFKRKEALENERVVAQLETEFRRDVQDKLFSEDEEDFTYNKQESKRSKGVLNRKLWTADGSTQDFDDFYFKKRDEYLSKAPSDDYRAKLASLMDGHYESNRNTIIKHESKEIRQNRVNTLESNVKQKINDAYGVASVDDLNFTINSVLATQDVLNQAKNLDEITSKLESQKAVEATVEKAVISALDRDNTEDFAVLLIEQSKENLSKEKIDDLESLIDKKKKEWLIISDVQQYENQKTFNENFLDVSVGDQLSELERGVGTGEYDSKWAKAKKDSILSSKGIDADIQFEFENEIIMGIADVKSQYKGLKKKKKKNTSVSREYLRSIRELETKIDRGVAQGLLNKSVGEKLIKSLYGQELSQATQNAVGGMSLGFKINDAHDYFKKNLNGEDLLIATREFFYKTDGEDISNSEKENLAVEISNNIKRSKLLSIIEQGKLQEFNSIEEADNSGLPEGTIVTVGGRRYQI